MDSRTIGVAGLGLLGRGIAACLLGHGFQVIAFTRQAATHARARDYITRAIDELISRAGFPASLADDWPGRYTPVDALEAFGPCEFVIESVVEEAIPKQQVFDRIEAVVGPAVPIASNTSAMPISGLQRDRRHPERLLGMHWAEPAHATRFMELIRGEQTSQAAFDAAVALARATGKDPSIVEKDVPAFIVNRLGYAMYREACHILEQGIADVETIDRSCRNGMGLWAAVCGPLRWIDISGGPALYARTLAGVLPDLCNDSELPETFRKLREDDARGTANGRGFYQYTEQEAAAWEQRFLDYAWTVREVHNKYFPLDAP